MRAAQQIAHTGVESAKLRFIQRVIQTQHGGTVRCLLESLTRLPSHALRWRIGRHQLGVFPLDRLQTPDERIVLGIADLRLVEYIILMFVMTDRLAQMFCVLAGIGR